MLKLFSFTFRILRSEKNLYSVYQNEKVRDNRIAKHDVQLAIYLYFNILANIKGEIVMCKICGVFFCSHIYIIL